MNSALLSKQVSRASTVPLLLAIGLLCLCGVLLNSQRIASSAPRTQSPTEFKPNSIPAEVMPSGVLNLPPATLAGNLNSINHVPPPTSSRDSFTLADLKAQMPQRSDGTFLMELSTIYFSASDAAARQIIEGKTIETTAQISFNADEGTGVKLCRSIPYCCSAHARRLSIVAKFNGAAPAFANGDWVTITGTVAYCRDLNGYSPVLQIKSMSAVVSLPTRALVEEDMEAK